MVQVLVQVLSVWVRRKKDWVVVELSVGAIGVFVTHLATMRHTLWLSNNDLGGARSAAGWQQLFGTEVARMELGGV